MAAPKDYLSSLAHSLHSKSIFGQYFISLIIISRIPHHRYGSGFTTLKRKCRCLNNWAIFKRLASLIIAIIYRSKNRWNATIRTPNHYFLHFNPIIESASGEYSSQLTWSIVSQQPESLQTNEHCTLPKSNQRYLQNNNRVFSTKKWCT